MDFLMSLESNCFEAEKQFMDSRLRENDRGGKEKGAGAKAPEQKMLQYFFPRTLKNILKNIF